MAATQPVPGTPADRAAEAMEILETLRELELQRLRLLMKVTNGQPEREAIRAVTDRYCSAIDFTLDILRKVP